jgi:hypothetical protein
MAMAAIAITSLFIAGSAFFAAQQAHEGASVLSERSALEAAEYGAAAVLRDWNPDSNLVVPVGSTLGAYSYAVSGATARARVTRTTPTTYWVVAEGVAGPATLRGQATRRVAVLYRLDLAAPTVGAALAVRDSAEVRPGGAVVGGDSAIAGSPLLSACRIPAAPVAGIAAPDTSRVCDGPCGSAAGHVTGSPPLLADARAADTLRYRRFGTRGWAALSAGADVVLPPNAVITPAPAVSGGACQRGLQANWGDPGGTSPCATYFPVISARGDLTISGGAGQGILLVDGDLRLEAGASFVGLVVASDDIITRPGGGVILGAAMAADSRAGTGDHTIIAAAGLIRYSACGVQMALFGSAPLHRVRSRSWAALH